MLFGRSPRGLFPEGVFFIFKDPHPIPSGNCQLFAVVVMLVVGLGVVAQKLNKYRKSPRFCGWRRGPLVSAISRVKCKRRHKLFEIGVDRSQWAP